MLDFKYIEEKFKEEEFDILKYEKYYWDNPNKIYFNFKNRIRKYIERDWSGLGIQFTCGLENNRLFIKVWTDTYDPPFGFEHCYDLNMLGSMRYVM